MVHYPVPYRTSYPVAYWIISYHTPTMDRHYGTLPGPIPYIIIPRHILNIEYHIVHWILNIVSPSILLHVLLKSSIIMLWYGFWFLMIYLMSLVRLNIACGLYYPKTIQAHIVVICQIYLYWTSSCTSILLHILNCKFYVTTALLVLIFDNFFEELSSFEYCMWFVWWICMLVIVHCRLSLQFEFFSDVVERPLFKN